MPDPDLARLEREVEEWREELGRRNLEVALARRIYDDASLDLRRQNELLDRVVEGLNKATAALEAAKAELSAKGVLVE